jgi:hypothetical protein
VKQIYCDRQTDLLDRWFHVIELPSLAGGGMASIEDGLAGMHRHLDGSSRTRDGHLAKSHAQPKSSPSGIIDIASAK